MNNESSEKLLRSHMPWTKNTGEPLKKQNFLSIERRIRHHHRAKKLKLFYLGGPASVLAISFFMLFIANDQKKNVELVKNLPPGSSEILLSSIEDFEQVLMNWETDEAPTEYADDQ